MVLSQVGHLIWCILKLVLNTTICPLWMICDHTNVHLNKSQIIRELYKFPLFISLPKISLLLVFFSSLKFQCFKTFYPSNVINLKNSDLFFIFLIFTMAHISHMVRSRSILGLLDDFIKSVWKIANIIYHVQKYNRLYLRS